MNYLSKKNPTILLQLVFAIITLVLTGVLALYFAKEDLMEMLGSPVGISVDKAKPVDSEKLIVDKNVFGIVHIEVDSPSYAQSNFDVNPLTAITVYVNDKVDLDDMKSKLSVVDMLTGDPVVLDAKAEDRSEEDMAKSDTYNLAWQNNWKQKVVFTPKSELFTLSKYKVTVLPGVYNESRTITSKNKFEFEFLTADKPGVFSTNLENGSLQKGDLIKITFRSPMNTEELDSEIEIKPTDAAFDLTNNEKIAVLKADLSVRDGYQLIIPGTVKDIYGRELGEDFVVDFNVVN